MAESSKYTQIREFSTAPELYVTDALIAAPSIDLGVEPGCLQAFDDLAHMAQVARLQHQFDLDALR